MMISLLWRREPAGTSGKMTAVPWKGSHNAESDRGVAGCPEEQREVAFLIPDFTRSWSAFTVTHSSPGLPGSDHEVGAGE
ncbi:hypothetical protein [Methanoregula sp.]|uniref:hypothetical protein n=1 Tax=Methanoregula sp. TaxID=2052170 RepID=UPI003565BEBD